MPKFEFQLAVVDEEDLPAVYEKARAPIEIPKGLKLVHRRKKEGDVVNVTKHPSLGNGRKTIDEYLIVVVDVKADITLKGRSAFVCKNCDAETDMFNNGEWDLDFLSLSEDKDEFLIMTSPDSWEKLACSSCGKEKFVGGQYELGIFQYFRQPGLEGGVNEFEDDLEHPILCKNRYSIELLALKTNPIMYELDLVKARDKTRIYQPFKTMEQVLIGKQPELESEIDCGTKPDEFVSVEWSDAEPIVWDNVLEKAVGPSDLGFKPEIK